MYAMLSTCTLQVFYAAKYEHYGSPCAATLRLLFSTNGITWDKLWEQDLREWAPKGFEPVSLTLPLGDGIATKFAVKWTYTEAGTSCWKIDIDDITFPAELPGATKPAPSPKPSPQAVMPPGVAPPPFPATFNGTCSWAVTYCGMPGAPTATNVTTTTASTPSATTNSTIAPGVNATSKVNTTGSTTAKVKTNSSTSSTTSGSHVTATKTATASPTEPSLGSAAPINAPPAVDDDVPTDPLPDATGTAPGVTAATQDADPIIDPTLDERGRTPGRRLMQQF